MPSLWVRKRNHFGIREREEGGKDRVSFAGKKRRVYTSSHNLEEENPPRGKE